MFLLQNALPTSIIVTAVFRGRRGFFGFNCPQETFFQGIYFSLL